MNRHQRRANGNVVTSAPVSGHCHVMLAKVAKDIAGAKYEFLMLHDGLFKEWKEANPGLEGDRLQKAFIDKYWGRYLDEARATLVDMLNGPYPEQMKSEIADALILDNAIRPH